MSGPLHNPASMNNLLSTQRALLDTLASFFTVAIHHILFLRRIYPPVSFVAVRAYNYPVRQNRHPDVCIWINDAIASLREQLENNTVEKVSLCIFECDNHQVLERWTFDLYSIPVISKKDRDVPFVSDDNDDPELDSHVNLADLEATFRATMSRISTSSAKLDPLPEGPGLPECSFTLTIQVREKADRPVGRLEATERRWIAAEPDAQQPVSPSRRSTEKVSSRGAAEAGKTHPVRRLEAGQLRLEVWVEESAQKFAFPSSQKTASQRAAEMSYGAGDEKFNPIHGYDLEEPDINRKPGGGTSTDYQRV